MLFENKKVVIPTFKLSNRYEFPAHKFNWIFIIKERFKTIALKISDIQIQIRIMFGMYFPTSQQLLILYLVDLPNQI